MLNLLQWGVPRQSKVFTPMSPYTKVRVKRTRLVQLLLRIFSLVGSVGILFCVICINRTDVALGWIIRVAVSDMHHQFADIGFLEEDQQVVCLACRGKSSHIICYLASGSLG
jgi:hypothetical protein